MEPQQPKTNLNIPIAIVLAGALMALAIYLRDMKPEPSAELPPEIGQAGNEIEIKSVSAKDHLLGSPKAPIVVVEYSDFDCPFCRSFHTTMQGVMSTYGKEGKVSWIYRHFPLYKGDPPLHPNAGEKAEASECAAEIGGNDTFWKFADALFSTPPAGADVNAGLSRIALQTGLSQQAFDTCLLSNKYEAVVEEQYAEALKAGGRGTPYSVLVLDKKISETVSQTISAAFAKYGSDIYGISNDGRRLALSGAIPIEGLKIVLDSILSGK